MRGEISSGRAAKRHPLDWYVEQGWEWDQIVRAIGRDDLRDGVAIWDPCAGYGHSGSRLEAQGYPRILLSDLVENVAYDDFLRQPTFFSVDFLETERFEGGITYRNGIGKLLQVPVEPNRLSIWMNPPYSYKPGIAEAFVRHALQLATHRVVALMPNKWLAPGVDAKPWSDRSKLFRKDHPPQVVLHFSTRPSMPPGDRIHLMGNRAFRGGMVDYCAIVWDVQRPTLPGETRTIWLPPLAEGV